MRRTPIPPLASGLYDAVISVQLLADLGELSTDAFRIGKEPLDSGESHSVLARYLTRHIEHALAGIDGPDRLNRQIAICNQVAAILCATGHGQTGIEVASTAEKLLSLLSSTGSNDQLRPDTPLAMSSLLTGATRLDPSLLSQLRKEIASADRIDILCSFIKWSGIRVLEDDLAKFAAKPNSQLRVITTSYMGATDLKAVDLIQNLPQTRLKVSYDTHRTRLHAKAYLFHRQTDFGSAYIGSANLSHAALTEGLEWNVKISQHESPHLWGKVSGTFETYWNDPEFVSYAPESRPRLRLALEAERGGSDDDQPSYFFDLRPYAFQQEILDRLHAERTLHGRMKHLVVAATGTGKTMIAAFDFRSYCERTRESASPGRPRILFVAHREEILKQSLHAFRAVLRDQNFGDLLVANHVAEQHDHLFVSIQSYNSKKLWETHPPEQFEYVVVDEFHHAAAPSYERLLGHIRPQVLLGLTATPERTDGLDVVAHFGGHISAELRLPDAITRKLLCPFQYFGITDSVDYSGLRWQRGQYHINDLDAVLTGNDARTLLILDQIERKLLDARKARGLGFCVSVAHAEYMAAQFCRHGIPSAALTGESDAETRRTIQGKLDSLQINFIFVVDLYNEGIDIPKIDTVLFLRPTESLTVFLQQLGRGLRLSEGKDCLTVLDFIGQSHRNYRFEPRFRALLDDWRRPVFREIEDEFPHLPAGCSIQLERIAMQRVLENIRQNLTQGRVRLVRQILEFAAETGKQPTLANFVEHYAVEFDDIYRCDSWSRLSADARIRPEFDEPDERALAKGLRRVARCNDPAWINSILLALRDMDAVQAADVVAQRRLLMFHFSVWGQLLVVESIAESLARLRSNPVILQELIELLQLRLSQISSTSPAVELPFCCPLTLHSDYSRDEILAGLGRWTLKSQPGMREGVLHMADLNVDLLLVTLDKTEKQYSPSTMYEDYAISEELFHWQSQSTTSAESPTGQRYIHHRDRRQTVLLFVREMKSHNGIACPYAYLGPVEYVSHTGSRPMSIVWRLRYPIPARLLRSTTRLATG